LHRDCHDLWVTRESPHHLYERWFDLKISRSDVDDQQSNLGVKKKIEGESPILDIATYDYLLDRADSSKTRSRINKGLELSSVEKSSGEDYNSIVTKDYQTVKMKQNLIWKRGSKGRMPASFCYYSGNFALLDAQLSGIM